MKLWWLLRFSLLLLLMPHVARAATCCGGGVSAAALISGDEKAQLTASYTQTNVVVDHVDAQGIWRTWDEHQQVRTVRLEGAHIFADRWQAGFALPVVQRTYLGQEHSGLGDLTASLGYEYLPEWSYHAYRPKGVGFLQLTLPTAKSRAESEIGGLDSRGHGFFAIGGGTLLSKIRGRFDFYSLIEVHRSFVKEFSNSQMSGEIYPGFGGNFGVGAGYNTKSVRLGGSVTWTYEDPIAVVTTGTTTAAQGTPERYATAVASVSYAIDSLWTTTLSYSDQTLFGEPLNTSLGRSLNLLVQRRWNR